MKRFNQLALVLFTVFTIVSCSQQPNYVIKKLPSGEDIKIASMGKMHFSDNDPALILTYYTDLSLQEKVKLQTEVQKIWEVFKFDVEKSGLNFAFIKASEMPQGIISSTRAFTFGFEKDNQGNWAISNPQK